jgi:biotin transport system substrate-specific component
VPMVPVPITMQTFGVAIVGGLFGWRLGTAAVLAWLVEAGLGIPVLSNGASGLAYMMGPTGGYLLAFPIAAALIGWLAERGFTTRSLLLSFGIMFAAHCLILAIGAAWLGTFVGHHKAIALGVTPFLLGSFLKAALATTSIEAARRHIRL